MSCLQISRVSSLVTTGLQTVGLGTAVAKPMGNEDRAPAGMMKKWQQHYSHGKLIQIGKFSCQVCALLSRFVESTTTTCTRTMHNIYVRESMPVVSCTALELYLSIPIYRSLTSRCHYVQSDEHLYGATPTTFGKHSHSSTEFQNSMHAPSHVLVSHS